MALEDRKHRRTPINTASVTHRFHIEVYDQRYTLDGIHDISISGTGIQIPNELEPGTPVKVVYSSPDFTVSVTGRTVWCAPIQLGGSSDETPGFRTGVQFEPSDRNVMLFFTALKDYITSPTYLGGSEQSSTAFKL